MHEALFSVGLLIVFAKLLEGVFKRFGLSAIIAYATSGVVLGPVTGLVETGSEVEIVLGIGIFLFFFLIGLDELDVRGFVAAIRGRLFLASVLSVVLSLLVSLSVTTEAFFDLQLELSFTQALALAGVLSLSSLGVVAKVLIDEGRLGDPVGVQIFTAVVIAELITLFVVGFSISEHLTAGHGHELDWFSIASITAQIIGFSVVTWVVSTKVLPRVIVLLHHLLQVPQLSFGLLLGGLFLVVVGRSTRVCMAPWERCYSAQRFRHCPTRCVATSCPECEGPPKGSSSHYSSRLRACTSAWISPGSLRRL